MYCFLEAGALDWNMVSTTLVERLDAKSCAPSGVVPTASITPDSSALWTPVPVRGGPFWVVPLSEDRQGGAPGPKILLRLARMELPVAAWPLPGILSPKPLGAVQTGKRHTDKAVATFSP